MTISNSERLAKCGERLQWFRENQRDIRKDVIMPHMHTIKLLVACMEYLNDIPDGFITELEETISRVEDICKPEDAQYFVYDQDFKI